MATTKEQQGENSDWSKWHDMMQSYHSFFEREFKRIYEAADKHTADSRTLRMFLDDAVRLDSVLRLHHSMEETHLFPVLAQRMPDFAEDRPAEHTAIHEGLDRYADYLRSVRTKTRRYDPAELRAVMDSFREVLHNHMANEVKSLHATNMMKYWTLEEVRNLL